MPILLAASGLSAVAGDIVELIAGDLIPADARLLESRDLFVKQIFYRFIAER